MELSKRLRAVADLVSPGLIIADVGTDHAYVPIHWWKRGGSRPRLRWILMKDRFYGLKNILESMGWNIRSRPEDPVD